MEWNKEYSITVISHIFLFVLLICATFLLLQLPALYYQKADSELLLEKEESKYQLKSVDRNFVLFSEKMKLFQNEYYDFALGEYHVFTEAEVIHAEECIAKELKEMFDVDLDPVIRKLEASSMESRGFQISVMDYTKESVRMWDVGVLTFREEEYKWEGACIYDVDSGKLFLVSCAVPGAWDNIDRIEKPFYYNSELDNSYMERIIHYYDGVEVNWEECLPYFGDEIFVAPFTDWELERSALLGELTVIWDKILQY